MNDIQCIGVIIDGNRRWAKAKGLASWQGHRAGYRTFKKFLEWSQEAGVKCVVAYVFSSENWNRAKDEVSYLMRLLTRLLKSDLTQLKKNHMRLRVLGARSRLPATIQRLVERAEEETKLYKKYTLALAISYGGRDEIIHAVNELLAQQKQQHMAAELITQEIFAAHLWSAGIPDPDLIIRTSGEMRLSNFLPWQSVYSELFFPKMFWPDFTKEEFLQILDEYRARQRRFGK